MCVNVEHSLSHTWEHLRHECDRRLQNNVTSIYNFSLGKCLSYIPKQTKLMHAGRQRWNESLRSIRGYMDVGWMKPPPLPTLRKKKGGGVWVIIWPSTTDVPSRLESIPIRFRFTVFRFTVAGHRHSVCIDRILTHYYNDNSVREVTEPADTRPLDSGYGCVIQPHPRLETYMYSARVWA